ncbi:hypothetical protein N0V85_005665 [Neurospora sp. IMI 360204]|nr:hypothetical protein N0V85_005665 [Neurospora sp. IMI 360204]
MAEEVDWENPGRNPLVTANLTLQSFEEYIGPNCTDDCSVAATKFLGYLRGTQDILNQTHGEKWEEDWDIPIYQLDNFIWYCTDENFPNYTLGQAADWFTNNANERSRLDHLVNHTINACPTEFCKSLIWEGNPDVSGIGVNVAFVVQTVLASLFLLFYIGFYITDVVHLNSEQAYPEQGNRSPADSQHDTPQQHEQTTAHKPTKLLDPNAVFALILFWGGSLLVIRILTPKMTDQGKHTVLTLYLVLTGIFGGFLVLTSLILVWLSLGFFMYLRQRVAGLSGPSYKENEWGFSQVAAVVAWVPFLGQFSVIVIC